MYNNSFRQPNEMINPNMMHPNDERFFGGFLGPFLLGGITGGLVSPLFNNSNQGYYQQPPYYTNNYYYPPYYYSPYY